MEVPHAGKRERISILGHFYIIIHLEVGRNPASLAFPMALWGWGRIWADSCIYLG
jgi:hypothetical protein